MIPRLILCGLASVLGWLFPFSLAAEQPALSIRRLEANIELRWTDGDSILERSTLDPLEWTSVAQVPSKEGDEFVLQVQTSERAQFFRLRQEQLPIVSASSPVQGETGVAVTRETILRFSEPLAENTVLSVDQLSATYGGRRVLSRVELSSDRRSVTLFYLENLPASARIAVRFDTAGIKDVRGKLLDGDGDNLPGGDFLLEFETLGNTPLAGTGVTGKVYASELAGGTNRPLAGVTVTVDGAEESLRAVTDTNGVFHLYPSPSGRFFVHVDGRTAVGSNWPNGAYYPFVGKAWEAIPGKSNNLAGGNGEIFLPLIQADALRAVSASTDTVIKASDSVLATNSAFADVALTVPANALFADNGTRGGKVGIAPVPPDRLPEPLPPGLNMPIVITVQTDGALNFDRPAPICFPNLPDPVLKAPLPAGSKQSLVSFNHDKGKWEAVGTMTVSADGKMICSDPGSGILQPGWHGVGCPPTEPPPAQPASPPPAPPTPPPPPCGTPHAKTLQTCYDTSDKSGQDCRDAAKVTRNRREKLCYDYFNPIMNGSSPEFNNCIKDADEKYRKDLEKCQDKVEKDSEACDQCWGAAGIGGQRVGAMATRPYSLLQFKFAELEAVFAQTPPLGPDELFNRVNQIRAEMDAIAQTNVSGVLINAIIDRQIARAALMDAPLLEGSRPPYPIKYAARILRPSGEMILRGETQPLADYQIFVPRDGILVGIDFYDPVLHEFGFVIPDFRPGASYGVPRVRLYPLSQDEPDSDNDRSPDIIEEIYGTNPLNPDSDGDGTPDGEEIVQGTNPLDGFPMTIGLIASVKTQGTAWDVAARNNLVIVAEGAAGVSIFDAKDSFNPIRIAQVDTPGDARAVAMEGPFAAAADGNAGLAIIDLTNPSAAFIAHQVVLPGNAKAVSIAAGLAYVGLENGAVAAIELGTGRILSSLVLGASGLQDVFAIGHELYALAHPKLFTLSFDAGGLELASENPTSEAPAFHVRRVRLNAGNGLLYAATRTGFHVFSLKDPLRPILLQTHQTLQSGWRQIVPNGSGLGVGVAGVNSNGDGTDDVYLHDLKPGETNNVFLTLLPTPGLAGALTLFNGLAYVADGDSGLQIVNYLAADTQGVPPTIQLGASFPLSPLARAESGAYVRLMADVGDDVQVRNTEFYLDGQLIGTDGNFPFEAGFLTPLLSADKTNFTVRAKTTDTGGNSTWSQEWIVELTADATSPFVKRITPLGGGKVVDRVTVYFSEPIAPASFNSSTARILSAGADQILDTADDLPVAAESFPVDEARFTGEVLFGVPLPDGRYRLTLSTGVTDLNGNPLTTVVAQDFLVADAAFWNGPAAGTWNNPLNWSTGRVPGTNEHVIIALTGDFKIEIAGESITVASLETFEEIEVTRGIITAMGGWIAHRDVILTAGTIRQGTLHLVDGATLRPTSSVFLPVSALEQMTINGPVVLGPERALSLRGGLTLNGSLEMDTRSSLRFLDTQTLSAQNIEFTGAGATIALQPNAIVTFSPGVIIRGRSGIISGGGTLINHGKLFADTAGSHTRVEPASFTHHGTAEVLNGAELTFGGRWNGDGSVVVQNGTFNLGGQFGPLTIPISKSADGSVRITGIGDLQNSTLTLNATTGSWLLGAGTLRNGTLNLTEGTTLRPTSSIFLPASALEQMTINGRIVLETERALNLRGGLTLNGVLEMGTSSSLRLLETQTLTSGTIEFTGASANIEIQPNATATFASGVSVSGGSGRVSGGGTFVNQGKLSAESAGGHIRIEPGTFSHEGSAEVLNGAELTFGGQWSGDGSVTVQNGTFNLGGRFGPLTIPISKSADGSVRITGIGDLQNSTLTLNATTGSWLLGAGTLRNGTLNLTEGTTLRPTSSIFLPASALEQMTINGRIVLETERALNLRGGLTLNGVLEMGTSSSLRLLETQTLTSGTIEFTGASAVIDIQPNTTVTLGSTVTMHGSNGTVSGGGTFINRGKISADVAGGTIRIQPATFINEGQLEAINGGTLVAPGFP